MNRSVFLKTPKKSKECMIWRLRRCVYGLDDASRQWYIRLRD